MPFNALQKCWDLYDPTLCELSGITLPEGLDGTSLVPIVSDARVQVKQAAHGFWHNGITMRTSISATNPEILKQLSVPAKAY